VAGVLFSSVVWVVGFASAPRLVLAVVAVGLGWVAIGRTGVGLRVRFGARPASASVQEVVLRAVVPVVSLRGRSQPQVWMGTGRRAAGWDVVVPRRGTLLVSDAIVAGLGTGRVSDVQVSMLVARALGRLPVVESRIVRAVELYCLPWLVAEAVASKIGSRLSLVALVSLSWRMRPNVFGLGLVDAVGHARWEAAIPLAGLAILTFTTGPLAATWKRTLADLGDRRMAEEGLTPPATRPSPSTGNAGGRRVGRRREATR
jgi:hypothetical protein